MTAQEILQKCEKISGVTDTFIYDENNKLIKHKSRYDRTAISKMSQVLFQAIRWTNSIEQDIAKIAFRYENGYICVRRLENSTIVVCANKKLDPRLLEKKISAVLKQRS